MEALIYIIDNAFRLLRRQWVLSLLTLITAAAMFWLLGIISLTSMNIRHLVDRLENELLMQAYLHRNADIEHVVREIERMTWVSEVSAISPEQALERLEERLGRQSHATRLIGENPLPWSIQIRVRSIGDIDILAKTVAPITDAVAFKKALNEGSYLDLVKVNNQKAWGELDFPAVPSFKYGEKLLPAIPGVGISREALEELISAAE